MTVDVVSISMMRNHAVQYVLSERAVVKIVSEEAFRRLPTATSKQQAAAAAMANGGGSSSSSSSSSSNSSNSSSGSNNGSTGSLRDELSALVQLFTRVYVIVEGLAEDDGPRSLLLDVNLGFCRATAAATMWPNGCVGVPFAWRSVAGQ
jgi:hypothetical protein